MVFAPLYMGAPSCGRDDDQMQSAVGRLICSSGCCWAELWLRVAYTYGLGQTLTAALRVKERMLMLEVSGQINYAVVRTLPPLACSSCR
jgi:hypothetical protein